MGKIILGIDPGKSGAIVAFGGDFFDGIKMPVINSNEIDFLKVQNFLAGYAPTLEHVYLERAVSFNMGRVSAFNYGRGFGVLESAIVSLALPVTYVEPRKWTKAVHAGIKAELDPKEKSLIAFNRLLKPFHAEMAAKGFVSKNGKFHDGIVDALLIAYWGHKHA